MGLHILVESETAALEGEERLSQVHLKNDQIVHADVFLVCAGIRSNLDLIDGLGLETNRGVVVDETMRTSDPAIFAAGDVCEYQGRVYGLWLVAVEQAKVAGMNAAGGSERYQGVIPVTMLKVVGVELTSVGRFDPESEDEFAIALEDVETNRYRKLVISDGRIVDGILIGYPREAQIVTEAVKQKVDVSAPLNELKAGEWEVLSGFI